MRERRFLVDPADLDQERALIRGGEHRHLSRVLRLGEGDPVTVFDGRGRGFRALIRRVERDHTVAAVVEPEPGAAEPPVRLVVLQSILHTERMEGIVEKITELGAAALVPVISRRSVVRPGKERWGRRERLQRIAVAAAKQSGRTVVPQVAEPVEFRQAVGGTEGGASGLRLILHGGRPAAAGLLREAPARNEVHLLVGPEGGWTEEEVALAAGAGWLPAGLGPRTLRADTAAVVAAGLVMMLLAGDPEP